MDPSLNVLGTTLETCSLEPRTGWFRDGCCNTDVADRGIHTVCCIVTEAFWSSHGREVMISSPLPLDSNSLDSSQGMLGAFVRELGRPQSMQVRDAQSISKQPISGRWMWSPSISSKLTRSDETVVRFGTEGQELEQDEVHQPP